MLKEKVFTVSEVAEELGITTGRVRQICRKGNIGTVLGKTRLLSERDVTAIRDRPDGRRNHNK